MAAPSETYVDPSIAANSGTGTSGDPFGDLQYALNTMTRDATNGDRINVKAGTDELLTTSLSLATYGTPTYTAPLIFRGYTSTAGDGGVGGINMQGNNASILGSTTGVSWIDMNLHNTGTADILVTGDFNSVQSCELNNSSGDAIQLGGEGCAVIGCHIHDISGYGVRTNSQIRSMVYSCYFKNGTKDFAACIIGYTDGEIVGNIMSLDGASIGIDFQSTTARTNLVAQNSILSSAGTGTGIRNTDGIGAVIINNLVEGFSGTGGKGISVPSTDRNSFLIAHNSAYNNTTDFNITSGEIINDVGDNESLGASPFDKSGSDTFANRFTYFAPANTGNVHGGAYVG